MKVLHVLWLNKTGASPAALTDELQLTEPRSDIGESILFCRGLLITSLILLEIKFCMCQKMTSLKWTPLFELLALLPWIPPVYHCPSRYVMKNLNFYLH
jgi:hypothetical protein